MTRPRIEPALARTIGEHKEWQTKDEKNEQYGSIHDTGLKVSMWGCPRGVMVKAMDCGIVVSEFVLQSRYYVHFRANTLGKDMNLLILPAMG